MRPCVVLVLLTSFCVCAGAKAAVAQDLRPLQRLPEFPACRSTAHPQLPQHWRATYLMAPLTTLIAPLTTGQLVLAEIVHDASLAATETTLRVVHPGPAEFLVSGSTT